MYSPPYSFVKFGASPAECCDGVNSLCLPVINDNDLQFQVISVGDPGALEVIRGNDGTGDVVSTQSGFEATPITNVWSWKSAIDISGLDCDECFQIKVASMVSNCFVKKCDPCFTSVIEYTNPTDYADFIYCNADFSNRARLFMYLKNARMNEDRAVYRKSQGTYQLTKSIITKEFTGQTEFMPVEFHDALMVAFGHGQVSIEASNYSGGVTLSGPYNPLWEDGFCVAPADFKVQITPLVIRNNNCQVCVAPVCVAVGISGTPVLPDTGLAGSAYSYSFDLTGDGPFTLGSITKPAWLSISISGASVNFSGTVADGGSGAVSIEITNCSGASTTTFTGSVTVPGACEGVIVTGSTTLPDAEVGVLYDFTIAVTGDAPFDITIGSKPSWLTVDMAGSDIHLYGTPDAEGAAIPVQFTISNCEGANTQDVDEVLDVAAATPIPRTLTFAATTATSFEQISATLDGPIDVDLEIVNMLADGYASGDCSGSSIGSVQAHNLTILAGGTSQAGSVFPTGDWTLIHSFTITGATIDINGGGPEAVIDAQVLTMGAYSVTIIFDGC